MVSTRRSGSLPSNNNNNNNKNNKNKKSSSPAESSSPKRQKGENINCNDNNSKASEKSTPPAENPKDSSSTDPTELPAAAASISDATPIVAEGAAPAIVDKARSSPTSWKQHQGHETSWPWCRLLSEFPKNPTVSVCTTNFTVGSSKRANLSIRDQTISAILCSIRLTQREGKSVAVLESRGSKGCVQVNGKTIKKNTTCDLNSGDEMVFGFLGNHAYIFQQQPNDHVIKMPPPDVQTLGKLIHAEKRAGDASAVAGASILASLSNLRQDLSRLKPPSRVVTKIYQGNELPPSPIVNEDDMDGQEVNSATNSGNEAAADVEAASKVLLPLDSHLESGTEVVEERDWVRDSKPASRAGKSLRKSAFREDILAAILDGHSLEVSFDNFPYYLSESTKNVLIAASYVHLKHKDQVKYTSELPNLNPRILLSGPAGSDIYQEMLAKALAHYFGAKLLLFDSHSFVGVR